LLRSAAARSAARTVQARYCGEHAELYARAAAARRRGARASAMRYKTGAAARLALAKEERVLSPSDAARERAAARYEPFYERRRA